MNKHIVIVLCEDDISVFTHKIRIDNAIDYLRKVNADKQSKLFLCNNRSKMSEIVQHTISKRIEKEQIVKISLEQLSPVNSYSRIIDSTDTIEQYLEKCKFYIDKLIDCYLYKIVICTSTFHIIKSIIMSKFIFNKFDIKPIFSTEPSTIHQNIEKEKNDILTFIYTKILSEV